MFDRTTNQLIKRAREYACNVHGATNHLYDDKPYAYHLQMVAKNAVVYCDILDSDWAKETAIAGAWVHDCIEDARQTYNDVLKATNQYVAEVAYALTNEKGRSRSERANDKYYQGIRANPLAAYVKICDRLANAQHSQNSQSRMLDVYRNEHQHFFNQVGYHVAYEELWTALDSVLGV